MINNPKSRAALGTTVPMSRVSRAHRHRQQMGRDAERSRMSIMESRAHEETCSTTHAAPRMQHHVCSTTLVAPCMQHHACSTWPPVARRDNTWAVHVRWRGGSGLRGLVTRESRSSLRGKSGQHTGKPAAEVVAASWMTSGRALLRGIVLTAETAMVAPPGVGVGWGEVG